MRKRLVQGTAGCQCASNGPFGARRICCVAPVEVPAPSGLHWPASTWPESAKTNSRPAQADHFLFQVASRDPAVCRERALSHVSSTQDITGLGSRTVSVILFFFTSDHIAPAISMQSRRFLNTFLVVCRWLLVAESPSRRVAESIGQSTRARRCLPMETARMTTESFARNRNASSHVHLREEASLFLSTSLSG